MDEQCHVDPVHKPASQAELQSAQRALLSVGGMGCNNCAARVRNGLLALDGVYAADVFLHMAVAEVLFDRNRVSTEMLVEAVRRAGNDGRHEYQAMLIAANA